MANRIHDDQTVELFDFLQGLRSAALNSPQGGQDIQDVKGLHLIRMPAKQGFERQGGQGTLKKFV